MIFDLVEKKDHDVIHASFASREDAEHFLRNALPAYVMNNLYCLGKGLSANDFEIIEVAP